MNALITIDHISHTYPDGTCALRDVSVSIGRGEYLAIVGQNGSGKSTLAKHLNGLLKPTQGRVTVDGVDTQAATIAETSRRVGYVFQNPNHQIFEMTALNEVAAGLVRRGHGRSEADEKARAVLAEVGLGQCLDEHPLFLGWAQRQLLAIASYLSLDPDVLILDEPTRSLDVRELEMLRQLLRSLHQQGRTIIVITHDVPFVGDEADRALAFSEGTLVFDGAVAGLFYNREVMSRCSLTPPPVVEVARRLHEFGWLPTDVRPVNNEQFTAAVEAFPHG